MTFFHVVLNKRFSPGNFALMNLLQHEFIPSCYLLFRLFHQQLLMPSGKCARVGAEAPAQGEDAGSGARMGAGREHIEVGYSSVKDVEQALQAAITCAQAVEDRVTSIVSSTCKEQEAADTTARVILNIAAMAEENSGSIEKTAVAAVQIADLANSLKLQIAKFKIA